MQDKLFKKNLIDRWSLIFLGFFAYSVIFILNYFLFNSNVHKFGFVVFFIFVLLANLPYLKFKRTKLTLISILFMVELLLPFLYSYENINIESFIKYSAFILTFLIAYFSNLEKISSNKYKNIFLILIILIILISFLEEKVIIGQYARLAGIFKNPNNLSLFSFMLLFFVDEEKDKKVLIYAIHIIISIVLIISATLGAISGYLAAIAFKLGFGKRRKVALIGLTGVIFIMIVVNPFGLEIVERINGQINILIDQGENLFSRYSSIDYGSLIAKYKSEGLLSGLYRLDLWKKSMFLYAEQDAISKIFGCGAGSSISIIKENLPHNEYLRILLETGLIGLIIYLILFFKLFRLSEYRFRYIYVLFAIFSFTENIFDNMMFMSLFAIFLASSLRANKKMPKIINVEMIMTKGTL